MKNHVIMNNIRERFVCYMLQSDGIFLVFAQNIDSGYLLENLYEVVQTGVFLPKKRKIINTSVNPTFACREWGFLGYSLHRLVIWCELLTTEISLTVAFDFYLIDTVSSR